MHVETLTTDDQIISITDEWRALQAGVGRIFFTDPAFFRAWWETAGKGHKLHFAVGRRDGRLVALAPLVVTKYRGIRVLEWMGHPTFDYCDTLAQTPEDDIALWQGIRDSRGYDIGFIRGISAASNCLAALETFANPSSQAIIRRIGIRWPDARSWMATDLSARRRQVLRRSQRQIAREGTSRFEVVRNVTPDILDAIIRWKAQKGQTGSFKDPAKAGQMCRRLAQAAEEAGVLHLSCLRSDDQIIAGHLGFEHRRTLHFYMPSYAPEWARFSPGNVLMAHLISHCIETGLTTLDLMRGDEAYKQSLSNSQIRLVDYSFYGSRLGKAIEPIFRGLRIRNTAPTDRQPATITPSF